eukprot:jgi/Botrbrau1/5929/Bobra.0366s0103.1
MGHSKLLLRLIITGSAVTLMSQVLIDAEFIHPNVQIVALIRYASVTWYTGMARRPTRPHYEISRRGRLLLIFNGCIDCFAYALNCIGFRLCGASLALTIFAASSQTLTSLLSYLVSKRRLCGLRLVSVVLVNVGVLLRSMSSQEGGRQLHWMSLSKQQLFGALFILLASLCYSMLGVCYELFLSIEKPPPPYSDYMHLTARIGLAAVVLHQLIFVLPQWDSLVAQPFAARGAPVWYLLAGLLSFGLLYNIHSYCSAQLFQQDGAVAVNLANACRGTVVSIVTSSLMCSEAKPQHCAGTMGILSAVVVSAGAAMWASTPSPQGPATTRPAASNKDD